MSRLTLGLSPSQLPSASPSCILLGPNSLPETPSSPSAVSPKNKDMFLSKGRC